MFKILEFSNKVQIQFTSARKLGDYMRAKKFAPKSLNVETEINGRMTPIFVLCPDSTCFSLSQAGMTFGKSAVSKKVNINLDFAGSVEDAQFLAASVAPHIAKIDEQVGAALTALTTALESVEVIRNEETEAQPAREATEAQ